MTFFKKQSHPRPLADRLKDFRAAIEDAQERFEIPLTAAIPVFEDFALNAKMRHAFTAPLPSTRPVYHSGNIDPPKTPFRNLARKIAGLPADEAA